MASQEEVDLLDTLWEEIDRPGHTVRIISWESARHYPYRRCVVIKHEGVHNKRAQSMNSIIEFRRFRSRYQRIDI